MKQFWMAEAIVLVGVLSICGPALASESPFWFQQVTTGDGPDRSADPAGRAVAFLDSARRQCAVGGIPGQLRFTAKRSASGKHRVSLQGGVCEKGIALRHVIDSDQLDLGADLRSCAQHGIVQALAEVTAVHYLALGANAISAEQYDRFLQDTRRTAYVVVSGSGSGRFSMR